MIRERVDLVIQFALLAAGQADERFERELGPIHLLKYVYLADLAYAERHGGETFTGADWEFFHFGPWAQEVHARIAPAVADINAIERTFASQYDSDVKRWVKQDNRLLEELDRKLPTPVVFAVRRNVREFGKDTEGLLHFVYTTAPMLKAAPHEKLVFEAAVPSAPSPPVAPVELSRKAEKKREARVATVKARFEEMMAKRVADRQARKLAPPPRYDDVYFEGVEWLDQLAGEPLPEGDGEVTFDDDVWASPSRTERRG